MTLCEQRGRARHMRGGHRSAGGRDVVRVDRVTHGGTRGPRRDDTDAGRRHIRLDGAVTHAGTAAGERCEGVVPVHRADGQGGVGRARRADGARALLTAVARGHDEQSAGTVAELVHRQAHRVRAVGGLVRPQAHVDHLGTLLSGPFHPGDDLRLRAEPVVAEDLADQELCRRRHSLTCSSGCGAGAADDRRDVRSVSEDVVRAGAAGEVLCLGDPSGEIRVGLVHPGVQHRDLDTLAVVAGVPHRRGADLGGTAVKDGVHPAVEPHPRHGLEFRGRRPAVVGPGDLLPERAEVSVGHPHRLGPDALEPADRGLVRGERSEPAHGRGFDPGGPTHDERKSTCVGGVVVLGDQGRHVEEAAVEPAGRHQVTGIRGEDRQVPVVFEGPEEDALPTRARLDRGDLLPVRGGPNGHTVAGEQPHRGGGGRARHLRGSGRVRASGHWRHRSRRQGQPRRYCRHQADPSHQSRAFPRTQAFVHPVDRIR